MLDNSNVTLKPCNEKESRYGQQLNRQVGLTNNTNQSIIVESIQIDIERHIAEDNGKGTGSYNDHKIHSISICDIDSMSGVEFEKYLCNHLLVKLGYFCEMTKASTDQGVDIIAIKNNIKIAIQAKCYRRPVGNHAVMEVIAGAKYYNASQCMVITNSRFTNAAKKLAYATGVILWDRDTIIEKIEE